MEAAKIKAEKNKAVGKSFLDTNKDKEGVVTLPSGLQLMKTGSKWMLYIPADLAYGDKGAGQVIGPGATLIFEVELLGIEG